MRALGMVIREPEGDGVAALLIVREVIARIETFALQRAVETLDAAIRPGVVGTGPRPAQPKLGTGLREAPLVSGAVVGEHATHLDPAAIEVRHRAAQEGDAVLGADRWTQLEIGLVGNEGMSGVPLCTTSPGAVASNTPKVRGCVGNSSRSRCAACRRSTRYAVRRLIPSTGPMRSGPQRRSMRSARTAAS